MIYFIQDTHSRSIKIGVSDTPVARLKALQTAHSSRLVLIGVMDGTHIQEQALHQLFTRKRGEWFEPTRDLLAFIREKAVPTATPSETRYPRASRRSIVWAQYAPELQGDEYLPSVARAAVYVINNGRGDLASVVDAIYSNYARSALEYPDIFPALSRDEMQSELQQLLDIQTRYQPLTPDKQPV